MLNKDEIDFLRATAPPRKLPASMAKGGIATIAVIALVFTITFSWVFHGNWMIGLGLGLLISWGAVSSHQGLLRTGIVSEVAVVSIDTVYEDAGRSRQVIVLKSPSLNEGRSFKVGSSTENLEIASRKIGHRSKDGEPLLILHHPKVPSICRFLE